MWKFHYIRAELTKLRYF